MLFSETTKEIILNQPRDLKEVIEHLKGFKFQEGDKSKIHEEFCLYIFLVGCFKISKLPFPIKVISNESPDFIFIEINKNKEIGIEHTRGTLESYKIAESELKKHPENSLIELCYYSPFTKLPKKKSDIGIIVPGDRVKAEGWYGDQVEQEWAEIILDSIKNKVHLLNEAHFERKEENQLIIEDDSPVDFVKRENQAIDILKRKYNQTIFAEKTTFDKIHIFSNCTLIYDIFRECLRVDLHKKELPNLGHKSGENWGT